MRTSYIISLAVISSLIAGLLAGSQLAGGKTSYLTITATVEREVVRTAPSTVTITKEVGTVTREVGGTGTLTVTERSTITERVTETVTSQVGSIRGLVAIDAIVYWTCVSNRTELSPSCDSPGDMPTTGVDVKLFPLTEVSILIKDLSVIVGGKKISPVFVTILNETMMFFNSTTLKQNVTYMLLLFIERVEKDSEVVVTIPYKVGDAIMHEVVRPKWIDLG